MAPESSVGPITVRSLEFGFLACGSGSSEFGFIGQTRGLEGSEFGLSKFGMFGVWNFWVRPNTTREGSREGFPKS